MKLLLSADELQAGVARLARQIQGDHGADPLTIVGVLTGSVVLLADLIRQLTMPLSLGLVHARSYRGPSARRGPLSVNFDFLPDIEGQKVLLVDDIFDTGRTLQEVLARLDEARPLSVRSAVLLRKMGRAEVPLRPDYVGFDIPDTFVVGYGLDYNGRYRNLPSISGLEESDLDRHVAGRRSYP